MTRTPRLRRQTEQARAAAQARRVQQRPAERQRREMELYAEMAREQQPEDETADGPEVAYDR